MKFVALFSGVLLAGCASPHYQVKMESQPPGAKVFLGTGLNESSTDPQNFLGTTPFLWDVEGNRDRGFKLPGAPVYSTFVAPVAVFEARYGTNRDRKVFHGGKYSLSVVRCQCKSLGQMDRVMCRQHRGEIGFRNQQDASCECGQPLMVKECVGCGDYFLVTKGAHHCTDETCVHYPHEIPGQKCIRNWSG